MPNYDAMKKELPVLKRRLTKAVKGGNPQNIIDTVDAAFARFEEIGYPDQWHDWQRAKDDAEFKLRLAAW